MNVTLDTLEKSVLVLVSALMKIICYVYNVSTYYVL